MEAQRRLLDQLLGADRNGAVVQKKFADPEVCKMYLCGCCPNELFTNTKMDLGECHDIHSEHLKAEYEEARKQRDFGYELELEQKLQKLVDECDRRIARGLKRIEEQERMQGVDLGSDALAREIADCIRRAEELAEQGQVDECKALWERAEQLRAAKAAPAIASTPAPAPAPAAPAAPASAAQQASSLLNSLGPGTPPAVAIDGLPPGVQQQQKLRVCDICSGYLSLFDSDRRLADHFGGKMHVGFLKVRARLKELKAARPSGSSSGTSSKSSSAAGSSQSRDYRDRERDHHYQHGKGGERDSYCAPHHRSQQQSRGGGRDSNDRDRDRDSSLRDFRRDRDRDNRERDREHERGRSGGADRKDS